MSLALLHGSDDAFQCELYNGALNAEILNALVECSVHLFSNAPNHDYVNRLNEQQSPLALIARNKTGSIIGYKLGYAISDDVFYSWLGGTLPAYQYRGIASSLMKAQHDWCKKFGFRLMRTKTLRSNAVMYALNLKHGFNVIGFDCESSRGPKLMYSKQLIST